MDSARSGGAIEEQGSDEDLSPDALVRQNYELRHRLEQEAASYKRRLDTYRQAQQHQAALVSRLQAKVNISNSISLKKLQADMQITNYKFVSDKQIIERYFRFCNINKDVQNWKIKWQKQFHVILANQQLPQYHLLPY